MALGRGEKGERSEPRRVSGDDVATEEAFEEGEKVDEAPREGEAVNDFFSLSEVFHRVSATAEEELSRHNGLLFASGLAGGLALGLSLLARAALTAAAPGESELVGNLVYPIGFILIILGRYQLYTENTLTPVTLVLTRLASVPKLLRLWGVVFAANTAGAALFAFFLARAEVLSPEASAAAVRFGEHLLGASWGGAFFKAVIAGWLLAGVLWLVHAARDTVSRLFVIWLFIFVQVSADLFHCVAGSVEVLHVVFLGGASFWTYLNAFLVPVTLGNTVGGVVFVAVLNYMQLGEEENRFAEGDRLSWREWLWGG